jgi:hypothetical protein
MLTMKPSMSLEDYNKFLGNAVIGFICALVAFNMLFSMVETVVGVVTWFKECKARR